MQPRIENAQQILDIIEPIPADKFITHNYGTINEYGEILPDDGCSCVLGHIHRSLSPLGSCDFLGDKSGYGARTLTSDFISQMGYNIKENGSIKKIDISHVNNFYDINGYTEPVIKDRVVHLLKDMIATGY